MMEKAICKMDIMRPRWMTNWERVAARLYAFLPCHRSTCLTYLNSVMEISEARAAWLPSLPTMPNPIEASWIIPTSLPPSPMPALQSTTKVHDTASDLFEFLRDESLLSWRAPTANDSWCFTSHVEEQVRGVAVENAGQSWPVAEQHLLCVVVL